MRLSVFLVCGIGTAAATYGAGQILSDPLRLPLTPLTSAALSAEAGHPFEEVTVEVPESTGGNKRISVAKHEVTFADWQQCVDARACRHRPKRRNYVEDNHPVSGVSWRDAQQYIAWISSETGKSYRLPLESEWRVLAVNVLDEKVDKLFDDPRLAWAADYANFAKRSERKTRPIGHFGTESNGVADIAGNVWEWTDSCWRRPTASNAGETSENCGGVRVLAGAHMTYQSELIRVVPTGGCSIGFPPANIGFRLVRDIDPATQTVRRRNSESLQTRGWAAMTTTHLS